MDRNCALEERSREPAEELLPHPSVSLVELPTTAARRTVMAGTDKALSKRDATLTP